MDLFQDAFEKIGELGELFNIRSGYPFLFLFALVFLCRYEKKGTPMKEGMVFPGVGVLLCVFNPFLLLLLDELVGSSQRYVRIYWLLPLVPVLAYFGVKMVTEVTVEQYRTAVFALLVVIFVWMGKSIINSEGFTKADNLYKLPQDAIELCKILPEDRDSFRLTVPSSLSPYIRQYDATVRLTYGRHPEENSGELYKLLAADQINLACVTTEARKCNSNYLALKKGSFSIVEIKKYWGYVAIDVTEEYVLYADVWNNGMTGLTETWLTEQGAVGGGDVYVLPTAEYFLVFNQTGDDSWVCTQRFRAKIGQELRYERSTQTFRIYSKKGKLLRGYRVDSGLLVYAPILSRR